MRIASFLEKPGTVFWIFGAGLLLRILLWLVLREAAFKADAFYYVEESLSIRSGALHVPYWPPALPHYLALAGELLGDSVAAIRFAMLFWYGLLSWGLWQLLIELKAIRAANLAVAILAFYPGFIHQSVEPLSQLPAAACLIFMCLFFLRLRQGINASWALPAGFACAMLVLFRPSALILIPFMPFIFRLTHHGFKWPWMIRFWWAAMLPLAIWIGYTSSVNDRFILINDANSRNVYLGNNAFTPLYKTWYLASHWDGEPGYPSEFKQELLRFKAMPPASRPAAFREAAWEHIRSEPMKFMARSMSRARTFWAFDTFSGAGFIRTYGWPPWIGYLILLLDALFYSLIVLGALVRIFLAGWGRFGKSVLLLLLLYYLPYCFSFSHPTYHLPLVPLLIVPAAMFWSAPLEIKAVRNWHGRQLRTALAVGLVFVFIQVEWVLHMI